MNIGVLTLELEIPWAQSLKDKRMVVNRVRDTVRKKFNVAVSEVEENDVWNRAVIAVVTVSNEQVYCNQVLDKVVDHVEAIRDCNLADYSLEFL
jgi:uncharacterized protein YlxP (DUF503 family)